ncbi:GNAT family N-acetyltransferase [Sphingobacterium sp. SYP-B4668]|uniref:GNAT family N-acetyltransferase n=1 Tax=Sphingobacterium sp. SYP-B4668 TaxID=2996035 RepID=UPI0022DD0D7C|nr:GNAT family N-acetyltransferase [Sphingobacterium sp. SYP-B4668]
MEIIIQEDSNKGYAMARVNGVRAGVMTYSKAGDNLIIIDSTDVYDAYKGQGIGKNMLYKIVEMARKKNIKIIPLCPFSVSVFKKNAEISDVLK